MNISPYITLNRIEFVITYQCSGRCKHCSVSDSLNPEGGYKHVSLYHATEAIGELSEMFSISSLMTFGGEPLLYADIVCGIHKAAARYGVRSRLLITNGYFTKLDEQCGQTAKMLKEAGIETLLLSVDAFHQETIPLDAVYRFARYAKEAGINVKLHPAWVVNENHSNPYNRKTNEILAAFTDLELPVSNGNNIFLAGNAALHLAEYYDKPKLNLSETCGSMPYTAPVTEVTSLSIVPNGDVMNCGFVLGNIYRQSIREIVARYDPYKNELMNAVLTGGAAKLLELAKQNGLDISRCYSICDVCHKVRRKIS